MFHLYLPTLGNHISHLERNVSVRKTHGTSSTKDFSPEVVSRQRIPLAKLRSRTDFNYSTASDVTTMKNANTLRRNDKRDATMCAIHDVFIEKRFAIVLQIIQISRLNAATRRVFASDIKSMRADVNMAT